MPNKGYWLEDRNNDGRPDTPHERAVETKGSRPFHSRLAIVEFDEQGDLWDPVQFRRAKALIQGTKRPLVVTFLHGWQNNARPGNKDLEKFDTLLTKLDAPAKEAGLDVVGIYLGWRGESFDRKFDWSPLNMLGRQLSFFSRKYATDRMAGIPLTTTIGEISRTARSHTPRGITILIGHSFGGRIVERVVGNALVAQTANSASSPGTPSRVQMPADFVLLINPASESLFALNLKRALKTWKEPRPAIVAVRSAGDVATGGIWTTGMRVGSFGGGYREYNFNGLRDGQHSYITRTVGSDRRQITHVLEKRKDASTSCPSDAFSYNLANATKEKVFIKTLTGCDAYELKKVNSRTVKDEKYHLPSEAYWVIQVPNEVLKGHGGDEEQGGIFSQPTREVFAALFKIANISEITKTPSGLVAAPLAPLDVAIPTEMSETPSESIVPPP